MSDTEIEISEESLLNFHLSYLTIKNFSYEPKKNTKKIIWQYLSSNNLLTQANDIDLEDREKIKSFEKDIIEIAKSKKSEIIDAIESSGKLDENTEKLLVKMIEEYKKEKNNA